jgi:hypothetical protein
MCSIPLSGVEDLRVYPCAGNSVKLNLLGSTPILLLFLLSSVGCSLFPITYQREQIHNPFPQVQRVAVLPFYNQSENPTVDTEVVAEKYYGALQAIPGFEVLPVGVTKTQWMIYSQQHGEPVSGADFQKLADFMGVEALVVGSVTDFDAYYPPRMAMTVHWYAANEGFHPIPNGYGLPWGTQQENDIPSRIVRDTQFDLARSQLATQTPVPDNSRQASLQYTKQGNQPEPQFDEVALASGELEALPANPDLPSSVTPHSEGLPIPMPQGGDASMEGVSPLLPEHWPNPTDLIPDPPSPVHPKMIVSHEPILNHTRIYRGDDPYFTERLSNYIESSDDARPASWQGYLKRSDDFIHFCCHLHITEMLESRGGREESDLIFRWPLSRY